MTASISSLSKGSLLDQAVDLAEDRIASAADNVGALAERASRLEFEADLRSATGRLTDQAEGLRKDVDGADLADRRALLFVAAFAALLAVAVARIARRRQAHDGRRGPASRNVPEHARSATPTGETGHAS